MVHAQVVSVGRHCWRGNMRAQRTTLEAPRAAAESAIAAMVE